jgi:hypothetical protein
MRLAMEGTRATLSRARSLSAAWADWIALDVPAREVKVGDCGLRGRGGGARSGSELSHMGIKARLPSEEAECWCLKWRSPSRSREGSRSAWGTLVSIGMRLMRNADAAAVVAPKTDSCLCLGVRGIR